MANQEKDGLRAPALMDDRNVDHSERADDFRTRLLAALPPCAGEERAVAEFERIWIAVAKKLAERERDRPMRPVGEAAAPTRVRQQTLKEFVEEFLAPLQLLLSGLGLATAEAIDIARQALANVWRRTDPAVLPLPSFAPVQATALWIYLTAILLSRRHVGPHRSVHNAAIDPRMTARLEASLMDAELSRLALLRVRSRAGTVTTLNELANIIECDPDVRCQAQESTRRMKDLLRSPPGLFGGYGHGRTIAV